MDVLLANALRKLRMEKGISQSQLARRLVGESSGGGSVSLLADYTRNLARVTPEKDGKWLPLDPCEAYANGAAKDIEILQGCNKDESNSGLLYVYDRCRSRLDKSI